VAQFSTPSSAQKTPKGSIPRSFIKDLLSRSDLVQIINKRVPLKKAGSSYKACCPFHDEKTPSFNVNAQKQFYHCFGCGASGDALKFLMDYDGLSFVEAVETLAALNGLEVPREQLSPKAEQQQQQKRNLYDVMVTVAKYYRQQLKQHPVSDEAKQYLKQRGVTAEIAKQFVIGFAPPGWDSLVSGLKADNALKQQLIETGMLIDKSGGKTYDRFRHRIMFPIRDGRGRVVAFGGRVLRAEDLPKYLNSPETTLFHKTDTLYGLYELRQSRQAFNQILVVEGYMDVVSLAQFGVHNAVATLGTAITESHLNRLFQQVNEVVFCFDGDEAGKKAAWKAMELSLPKIQGTQSVRFLFLAAGEDPDSTIRKEGVAGFQARVNHALTLSDFLFKGLIGQLPMPVSTVEGQQQLIALAKPYIISATGAMPDLLTKVLSDYVELPVWRLGQIMGIRVSSTKREKTAQTDAPVVTKVTSLVLKIIKLILMRPRWSEVFSAVLLEDLSQSEKAEYRFLAQFIQVLSQNNFIVEAAEAWISEPNKKHLWQKIDAIVIQQDDVFIQKEFEACMLQVGKELKKEQEIKKIRSEVLS